ncbi:transcription factor DIVARICATA-like isoform X2 [Impatiens glandulifera]|nr:transcription factor DIVARICATA-like isoform X2 [Impatiens glandulifera]
MEALNHSLFDSTLNWLIQDDTSTIITNWSKNENKIFEKALAKYDETTPDRWEKIAAMIPGKTASDVLRQYSELEADVSDIEAGLVPIPGYLSSSFTMEMVNSRSFEAFKKRNSADRSSDQERKKGVPWTEEEHRRFLMGLQRYGKGDWRSISRNFVISKTPTQVASHAQKYFIRLNSGGGKDKRRPSIHDITTVHLTDSTPISDNNNESQSQTPQKEQKLPCPSKEPPQWFLPRTNNGMEMLFNSNWDNNPFPCEMASYLRPHNSMLQMQSKRYQIHG